MKLTTFYDIYIVTRVIYRRFKKTAQQHICDKQIFTIANLQPAPSQFRRKNFLLACILTLLSLNMTKNAAQQEWPQIWTNMYSVRWQQYTKQWSLHSRYLGLLPEAWHWLKHERKVSICRFKLNKPTKHCVQF